MITEHVVAEQLELLPGTHQLIMVPSPSPLPIRADAERVRTIIRNLLDNAIKYSPDGGVVQCRLSKLGDRAELEVADPGIGIDPGDYPRLFQRFGRVVGKAYANIPGTGLGLYLCQELAHRHGGEVRVRPGADSGSCFTLSIPLAVSATSSGLDDGGRTHDTGATEVFAADERLEVAR
jgi:signal transduction histidine kinase